ncbi:MULTISPECIES: Spy/CpxP family protein refolding chaperone [Bradyrhizobium]|uniref:Spy/CpxP family protein refolding chaperone n=1 Tax=Bradyrhizobium TaxID=374 RepID=UPI001B8A0115|nr:MULTISPECIES: Spy/CpxP family protein refolding chaperone [Bradyrhizobium]MBR0972907.1 Spy/CpxP family protein refolding chaperone [Bradyrhizobium japonicum]
MLRPVIGIAAMAFACILAGTALGKGGGGHGGGHGGGRGGGGHGGGHHGGGHFGGNGFGHAHGGGHHGGPHFATGARHGGPNFGQIRNAAVRPANFRNALNAHSSAFRNSRLIGNPAARAQIAAAAALAGWHGASSGWWQHAGGGYGWVGPLFWPFAYNDLYDYTIWGDGLGFWGYGYPDIYAGIFGPYGYDGLSAYLPQRPQGRRQARGVALDQLCGSDRREIVGLPIDQIAATVQPSEAQGASLDELGNASIQAAGMIRASCPAQVAATAPGRLAAMQQRIEAMEKAVDLVQPALDNFYGLLSDEQKARFNALAQDQRRATASNNTEGSLVQNCGAPAALDWPSTDIEARLHPNDTQRATLQVLQDTSARVSASLKAACQPSDVMTPPARMAAVRKRLDIMLDGVKSVRAALEDFYGTLNDEQKAQFEAIGPRRTS